MKLGENILLISPEPWDHLHVSKHHYAKKLADSGHQVFFLNPPKKGDRLIVKQTEFDNLLVIEYGGFIKGLKYFPSAVRKFQHLKIYRRIESIVDVSFDVVWSFDNSVFYEMDILPAHIKISHIVDLNQNFQTKRAASSADFCFGVTDEIVNRLKLYNKQTFKISHGLNTTSKKIDVRLPGDQSIKILYAGNLAMKHLDWKILYEAANKYANIDFIFIGSGKDEFNPFNATNEWKSKILKISNGYFLPAVSSEEIHSYLQAADVLLIAYQQKHHKDQANVHKLLEYLNSGNPIVATYTSEYEGNSLLTMSTNNDEWLNLLGEVVENLKAHKSSENTKARQLYASRQTYEARIAEIKDILRNH
jgi:hypothetical protein